MLVVDSCVLICLSRIGKLDLLRNADECCTTEEVCRETVIEGKRGSSQIAEAFEQWLVKKSVDREKATAIAEKEGIEPADGTLLLLAEKMKSPLLTNDKALITLARSRDIKAVWITSLLIMLCKEGAYSKEETLEMLYKLVQSGLHIRTDVYARLERKIREF